MKLTFLKKRGYFLLPAILLITAWCRFGGITWGLPYHFHPDEWNMAAAVTRLSWADRLNPEFFAYGQLPLYLVFFSAKIYNLLPWLKIAAIDLNEAIFFLRFWSALAGVGTVYLVYLISKHLLNSFSLSLMAALLAGLTPGLIQISHFGTTESLLSFFFLAAVYFSLQILEKPTLKNFLGAAVPLGLALGTKISALVFSAPLLLSAALALFKEKPAKKKLAVFPFLSLSLVLALALALAVSPYLILGWRESQRILLYETQVARGIIEVFYTRQFFKTLPVFFQIQKIFPYALGWPIFILGSLGFTSAAALIIKAVLKRKISNFELQLLTLNFAFLTYFLSQAFLFTKWTRFMAPIFAFFPIFAALPLSYLSHLSNLRTKPFLAAITAVAILPGLLFSTIYLRPDIRSTASEWILNNIPAGAKILSETGNVVDIPFYRLNPISFDFYHLDEDPKLFDQLLNYLQKSDYIFVPSRRIFANHFRLKDQYPKTAKYYELLFSGKLGFTEIKKFQLLADENAEETWSVFDHPTIRIYQKTVKLSKTEYEKLFQY